MELGPGILNNIFDGIQRPLKQIAVLSGDCFIPRGVSVPSLDASKAWEFHPTGFKVRPGASRSRAAAASWRAMAAWTSRPSRWGGRRSCFAGSPLLPAWVCSGCRPPPPHTPPLFSPRASDGPSQSPWRCVCAAARALLQVGDRITSGDIYGIVHENSLVEHRIMLPPNAKGTITYIAPAGNYNVNEEIIEVEFAGIKKVRGAARRSAAHTKQ